MTRLLRQPGFIRRRLLVAFVVTLPASGFFIWLSLVFFAAPSLLNSDSIIPAYAGFHINYPYPSLMGAVHNLRCRTNGVVIPDGFSYSCRFSMKPSNVEQFIQWRELSSTKSNHCIERLAKPGTELAKTSWFPPEDWWKPLELVEGQCYSNPDRHFTLFYSPTSQIAYLSHSDY
ncbi:hypothetical protein [Leptolyngbya subtilissima]|uniref:Uncharacterized protein n=1 Tax=Leptolyngbya subtilissima DQ-A4 TaxID=2933933 RepID=A0ABV0K8P1_9CYAN|nr:hypothetical protein [Nodosilinea sp. FACHB-141]